MALSEHYYNRGSAPVRYKPKPKPKSIVQEKIKRRNAQRRPKPISYSKPKPAKFTQRFTPSVKPKPKPKPVTYNVQAIQSHAKPKPKPKPTPQPQAGYNPAAYMDVPGSVASDARNYYDRATATTRQRNDPIVGYKPKRPGSGRLPVARRYTPPDVARRIPNYMYQGEGDRGVPSPNVADHVRYWADTSANDVIQAARQGTSGQGSPFLPRWVQQVAGSINALRAKPWKYNAPSGQSPVPARYQPSGSGQAQGYSGRANNYMDTSWLDVARASRYAVEHSTTPKEFTHAMYTFLDNHNVTPPNPYDTANWVSYWLDKFNIKNREDYLEWFWNYQAPSIRERGGRGTF